MSSRSCDSFSHKRFAWYRTFSIYPLYRCSRTYSHFEVQQISSKFRGFSWRNDNGRGSCPWNHTWDTQIDKCFWHGECIEVLWKMAQTHWWFAEILIRKKCRVYLDNVKTLHILNVFLRTRFIKNKFFYRGNYLLFSRRF